TQAELEEEERRKMAEREAERLRKLEAEGSDAMLAAQQAALGKSREESRRRQQEADALAQEAERKRIDAEGKYMKIPMGKEGMDVRKIDNRKTKTPSPPPLDGMFNIKNNLAKLRMRVKEMIPKLRVPMMMRQLMKARAAGEEGLLVREKPHADTWDLAKIVESDQRSVRLFIEQVPPPAAHAAMPEPAKLVLPPQTTTARRVSEYSKLARQVRAKVSQQIQRVKTKNHAMLLSQVSKKLSFKAQYFGQDWAKRTFKGDWRTAEIAGKLTGLQTGAKGNTPAPYDKLQIEFTFPGNMEVPPLPWGDPAGGESAEAVPKEVLLQHVQARRKIWGGTEVSFAEARQFLGTSAPTEVFHCIYDEDLTVVDGPPTSFVAVELPAVSFANELVKAGSLKCGDLKLKVHGHPALDRALRGCNQAALSNAGLLAQMNLWRRKTTSIVGISPGSLLGAGNPGGQGGAKPRTDAEDSLVPTTVARMPVLANSIILTFDDGIALPNTDAMRSSVAQAVLQFAASPNPVDRPFGAEDIRVRVVQQQPYGRGGYLSRPATSALGRHCARSLSSKDGCPEGCARGALFGAAEIARGGGLSSVQMTDGAEAASLGSPGTPMHLPITRGVRAGTGGLKGGKLQPHGARFHNISSFEPFSEDFSRAHQQLLEQQIMDTEGHHLSFTSETSLYLRAMGYPDWESMVAGTLTEARPHWQRWPGRGSNFGAEPNIRFVILPQEPSEALLASEHERAAGEKGKAFPTSKGSVLELPAGVELPASSSSSPRSPRSPRSRKPTPKEAQRPVPAPGAFSAALVPQGGTGNGKDSGYDWQDGKLLNPPPVHRPAAPPRPGATGEPHYHPRAARLVLPGQAQTRAFPEAAPRHPAQPVPVPVRPPVQPSEAPSARGGTRVPDPIPSALHTSTGRLDPGSSQITGPQQWLEANMAVTTAPLPQSNSSPHTNPQRHASPPHGAVLVRLWPSDDDPTASRELPGLDGSNFSMPAVPAMSRIPRAPPPRPAAASDGIRVPSLSYAQRLHTVNIRGSGTITARGKPKAPLPRLPVDRYPSGSQTSRLPKQDEIVVGIVNPKMIALDGHGVKDTHYPNYPCAPNAPRTPSVPVTPLPRGTTAPHVKEASSDPQQAAEVLVMTMPSRTNNFMKRMSVEHEETASVEENIEQMPQLDGISDQGSESQGQVQQDDPHASTHTAFTSWARGKPGKFPHNPHEVRSYAGILRSMLTTEMHGGASATERRTGMSDQELVHERKTYTPKSMFRMLDQQRHAHNIPKVPETQKPHPSIAANKGRDIPLGRLPLTVDIA
ncbi:hypothetical protein CYMTET_52522, partial [Cymbomonas tetramitiformis]